MKNKKEKIIITILSVILLILIILIVNKSKSISKEEINNLKNLENTKWISKKVILYKEGKEGMETPSDLVQLNFQNNKVQICFISDTSNCIHVKYFKKENTFVFEDNELLKLKNNYFEFEDNDLLLKGEVEEDLKIKYYFEEVK